MKRLRVIALFATLAMAAAASAAGPPDFAGTWAFDAAKGQNLGMMAAMKLTLVIAQTPAELKIKETSVFQGAESGRDITYDLAGKPVANDGPMGGKAETVARWVDGKLVVTWTSEGAVAGTKTVRTETRSLSPDGRTMTVEQVRGTNPPVVMVYEKK